MEPKTITSGFLLAVLCWSSIVAGDADGNDRPRPMCIVNGEWKVVNKSRQICCPSPFEKILDIQARDNPDDYFCCQGIARRKSDFHCCDDMAIRITPDNKHRQCCGKVLESHDQFCCNKTLHQKFTEDTTPKEHGCCPQTKIVFTIGQERCTEKGVLPFDEKYCGDKIYNRKAKMCCGGVLSDRHSEINKENDCCGNQSYSQLDGNCCHDEKTGRSYVIGEAYECCGSGKILKATQFCCNGIGYNRSSDLQCCGDVGVFNKNHLKCCKSGSRYTLTKISNAKDHGKCCGDGDKLQAYDDRKHQCCKGELITMKKPSDDACGYNDTANVSTTNNSQKERYPVSNPKGHEYAKRKMCGGDMIRLSSHTCCNGIATLNLPDRDATGKCCRHKLYDNRTHDCCYGEIIDKKEWQCCKIPKDKRKLSEKCEKFEMCGGEPMDPRTRMCCDDVDHPRIHRSGQSYSCCGMDRVLSIKKDVECCAEEVIDPGTEKCCRGKPMPKDEKCLQTKNRSKAKHSFPPHDISDTCSGLSYDMTRQWCLKGEVVPVKDILPGSCAPTLNWKPILKKHGQPQPLKMSILVIMTTASHPKVLRTSSGDFVLHRQARVVEDLTRVPHRRRLGKRINLLIPLNGPNQCNDILEESYRRFILITSQELWRGMLMFESNDVLFKYEGRFVKRMEEVLYARRDTRKNGTFSDILR